MGIFSCRGHPEQPNIRLNPLFFQRPMIVVVVVVVGVPLLPASKFVGFAVEELVEWKGQNVHQLNEFTYSFCTAPTLLGISGCLWPPGISNSDAAFPGNFPLRPGILTTLSKPSLHSPHFCWLT
jgi:hypothetical protein